MAVTYLMEAFTGHPFSEKDVNVLFSAKKIFQRWRAINGFKQLSHLKKQSNNKIPEDLLDTMPSLNAKRAPCMTDIILSIPSYRREVYDAWKLSWEEAACPELVVFNRYCKQHHKMPFYAPNQVCFADKDIDDLKDVLTTESPYQDLAIILLNECENNDVFDARIIMLDALKTLSKNPDDIHAHHVIWALSTVTDNTLAIQYILHVNPDHVKYYDYLDWRYCDDGVDEELDKNLLHTETDTGYDANKNIFNVYPKSSAILRIESSLSKISQTLLRDKIKSTFSTIPIYKRVSFGKQIHDILSLKTQISKVERFLGTSTKPFLINYISGIRDKVETLNTLISKTSSTYTGLDLKLVNAADIDALLHQSNALNTISLETLLMTEASPVYRHLDGFFEDINEHVSTLETYYSQYNELSKNPIEHREGIVKVLGHISDSSARLTTTTEEICEAYADLAKQISERVEKNNNKSSSRTTPTQDNDTVEGEDKESSLIIELEEQINLLNNEVTTLNNEKDMLKCELKRTKAKADAIVVQPKEVNIDRTPDSLTDAFETHITKSITPFDVLTVLDHAFDSLVVLPSAFSSASDCNQFKQSSKMYNYIKVLVTKYLDDINAHKPDTEARKHFGTKAYAANESKSVSNNAELMKLRTFEYNNEKVIMEQHLVIGVSHNTNETMRIHFKVIDGKIVIGHAGCHLSTSPS